MGDNCNIEYAIIVRADKKTKQYCKNIDSIYEEKKAEKSIKPKSINDFIPGHLYYINWKEDDGSCTFYKCQIVSYGVSEDDAWKNAKASAKRIKWVKKLTSSDSTDTQDENKKNTVIEKNLTKKKLQEVSKNLRAESIKAKFKENDFLKNRRVLSDKVVNTDNNFRKEITDCSVQIERIMPTLVEQSHNCSRPSRSKSLEHSATENSRKINTQNNEKALSFQSFDNLKSYSIPHRSRSMSNTTPDLRSDLRSKKNLQTYQSESETNGNSESSDPILAQNYFRSNSDCAISGQLKNDNIFEDNLSQQCEMVENSPESESLSASKQPLFETQSNSQTRSGSKSTPVKSHSRRSRSRSRRRSDRSNPSRSRSSSRHRSGPSNSRHSRSRSRKGSLSHKSCFRSRSRSSRRFGRSSLENYSVSSRSSSRSRSRRPSDQSHSSRSRSTSRGYSDRSDSSRSRSSSKRRSIPPNTSRSRSISRDPSVRSNSPRLRSASRRQSIRPNRSHSRSISRHPSIPSNQSRSRSRSRRGSVRSRSRHRSVRSRSRSRSTDSFERRPPRPKRRAPPINVERWDEEIHHGVQYDVNFPYLHQYHNSLYAYYQENELLIPPEVPNLHPRYAEVDGEIYLGLKVFVRKDAWQATKNSKKIGIFCRNLAVILWGGEINLANKSIYPSTEIINPAWGPRTIFSPQKMELYFSLVDDFINEKMPGTTESKKYEHLHGLTGRLCRKIQDLREKLDPHHQEKKKQRKRRNTRNN